MGLWDGDSSAHLSNCIHGKLTMILPILLGSPSLSLFSIHLVLSQVAASAVLIHFYEGEAR